MAERHEKDRKTANDASDEEENKAKQYVNTRAKLSTI